MSAMTRRARPLLRLLLSAALLYGSGAHWLLVQGAAWAGMLAARSGRETVARAVTTTFDGAHPCRVCLLVKRGAARDSAPRASVAPASVDFAFSGSPRFALRADAARAADAGARSDVSSVVPVPPVPPPNRLRAA